VDKSFEYRGDLATTPLADVLFSIYRYGVPGVMEAKQGGVTKRLYVSGGSILHAASSDRNDSLGVSLRRSGRLTVEQFAETMRERAASERRYGALLVERGLLTPGEVCGAVREQVRLIVWTLFAWEAGEVTFRLGQFEPREMLCINLPLRRAVVEGIQRAGNAKALLLRLGRKETLFEPCFRTEDLIVLELGADEHRLLGMINAQRTLYELCTCGVLSPADGARLLYALKVLQLIRRVGESSGAIKIRLRTEGDAFLG
jgi:hypothetical protein